MKQKFWAEFFGTFALVFCGCGAVVINDLTHGAITGPGIALTFGLVIVAMIYTFGDISGAHFNPAVTIAFAAAKKFEPVCVLPYIAAQVLGAIVAALFLHGLFPMNPTLGTTSPTGLGLISIGNAAGAAFQALAFEIVLAWLLMITIFNVSTGAKEKGITAGLVVGAVIGLENMFAGPICGPSLNPARSIGPALVSMHLDALWVYIVGPILGALLAIPTFALVRKPETETA